jgi:5-methyltetrahydrofolate--homocysteine methyltransferase
MATVTDFLKALRERVLIFDGGMGSLIQAHDLSLDDFAGMENCSEILVETRPDVIADIHASYLEVGCDAIETNSFGGTSIVLAEFGIAERAYELNVKAAELARRVAADFSTPSRPRWVVGSIGPTTKLPSIGHIDFEAMKASFLTQVHGLIDGGVDVLLVETAQDLLQAKIALIAIFEAMREKKLWLPVMAQATFQPNGQMLGGSEIGAVLTALEPFPLAVIGMNCSTGPKDMWENVRYLCENSPLPVSCIPNAGLPELVKGRTVYTEEPESMAADLAHFVKDFGVSVVGGCCGTTPAHMRALVDAVGGLAPRARDASLAPSCSSLFIAQPYEQQNSFLIVGERTNASGSKKCRDLLTEENWDGLVSLAKEQVREGAHVLDVNVDFVGRDGVRDMHALAARLVTAVTIPLMLDSTEWQKMEAGLQHAGGKCILNSTNYEDGEPRFAKILELCKTYGAGVVIGLIDETGMARTADHKVAIARRAYEQATTKYGIPAHDIFFDPLALPISTGIEEDRRNAAETIKALEVITAELPECNTILGVSNVSFGLNPVSRVVLNSVFLHLATGAGLKAAIVNASKILPLNRIEEREREVARRLVFDERVFEGDICTYDPLAEFTDLFAGASTKRVKEDTSALPVEERLKRHIVDGEKIGLEAALKIALETYSPLAIINDLLLDGMKTVGDLFGSGQMQLPFVLQSAEVMKAAVRFLEPLMEKASETNKGTMVIATVKGDVHDIGKNLVDIILTNNGYRVVNLGIKQPIDAILAAYEEHRADAIGMSGLLVKSTVIMKENLEVLHERGISVPVVLGGAALTRRYVEADLRPVYPGSLFYAADAFDGLRVMDTVMAKTGSESVAVAAGAPASVALGDTVSCRPVRPRARAAVAIDDTDIRAGRSAVAVDAPIPKAPFFGTRVVEAIPLAEVFRSVNESALFKGQWQIRQGTRTRDEFAAYVDETVRPTFERLKAESIREKLLVPKVVYGYFPCQSEGDDLIIYHDDGAAERARFTFPRQRGGKRLCLSDFFAPRASGRMDVVAFHLVTVGRGATEHAQRLFKSDSYAEYLYFHGLSVETAEALAEYWHKRIREELKIAGGDARDVRKLFQQHYQGSRYSFGYPACPNLEDQTLLFELLDPSRIDVTLSEEYQLDPEQSTSAIVVHHPEAKYFNVD